MPRRQRKRPYPAPYGHRAAQAGRAAPALDDLQVTLAPVMSQAITRSELVAVEHIVGPALLDLLGRGVRDSVDAKKDEVRDAEA